jgi:hypothetical protein
MNVSNKKDDHDDDYDTMNIMQICPLKVLPTGIGWITYEVVKSGVVMWNEKSVFLG